MRIIRNGSTINKVSENIKQMELSNITLLTSQSPIFGDYYSIDPELSETVAGMKDVETFIGEDSRVVYNKIENLPVYFNSDFSSQIDFSAEETGQTISFNVNGTVLPSSIQPKANEFFVPYNTQKPLLLRVTNYAFNDFKDMPFFEVSFDLASMTNAKIIQLNKQVASNNIFTMSDIGTDRFAVIEKSNYEKKLIAVRDYLSILNFYKDTFLNVRGSSFTFKIGSVEFDDIVFASFLLDNSLITCDPIVTFARSNMDKEFEHIFIAQPFMHCIIRNTPFEFLLNKEDRFTKNIANIDFGRNILQEVQPNLKNHAKLGKLNRMIIHEYTTINKYEESILPSVFNYDYLDDIINKNYPDITDPLKLAVAKLYNNEAVDFANLTIVDEANMTNFYLIPIVLWYYRKYIETLK